MSNLETLAISLFNYASRASSQPKRTQHYTFKYPHVYCAKADVTL